MDDLIIPCSMRIGDGNDFLTIKISDDIDFVLTIDAKNDWITVIVNNKFLGKGIDEALMLELLELLLEVKEDNCEQIAADVSEVTYLCACGFSRRVVDWLKEKTEAWKLFEGLPLRRKTALRPVNR